MQLTLNKFHGKLILKLHFNAHFAIKNPSAVPGFVPTTLQLKSSCLSITGIRIRMIITLLLLLASTLGDLSDAAKTITLWSVVTFSSCFT